MITVLGFQNMESNSFSFNILINNPPAGVSKDDTESITNYIANMYNKESMSIVDIINTSYPEFTIKDGDNPPACSFTFINDEEEFQEIEQLNLSDLLLQYINEEIVDDDDDDEDSEYELENDYETDYEDYEEDYEENEITEHIPIDYNDF